MSTTLLNAAKTLVEAEKESRRASLAVREAHRSCSTHSYGYCADSVCIDAEQALESAVRAELEAQTAALVELRKLAEANGTKDSLLRDKTVLFDGEFRPSAEWRELAAKNKPIEPHCFECGASGHDVRLVQNNAGDWDCEDEAACSERCREAIEVVLP